MILSWKWSGQWKIVNRLPSSRWKQPMGGKNRSCDYVGSTCSRQFSIHRTLLVFRRKNLLDSSRSHARFSASSLENDYWICLMCSAAFSVSASFPLFSLVKFQFWPKCWPKWTLICGHIRHQKAFYRFLWPTVMLAGCSWFHLLSASALISNLHVRTERGTFASSL